MVIHPTAPRLRFLPQRGSVSDAALAQALPRKQTNRDLGLVQPTAVLGGVVHLKPIPQPASASSPKRSTTALRVCESECPAPNGWCRPRGNGSRPPAGSRQTRAKSGRRSPWGSTVPLLAAPRRTRWRCRHAGIRRRAAPSSRTHGQGRTHSWCSTTGFSSTQTTGSRSLSGFSYTAKMSSMRRIYSSSSSATHHIFFPPRLQVVAFEQDPDRFPSHPRHQFAFHHFFRQQAHGPPRTAFGRGPAGQSDDALPLLGVEQALFPAAPARTRPAPSRLADSVGWSAKPSLGLSPSLRHSPNGLPLRQLSQRQCS